MADLNGLWPWFSLALLGAFHGLNPAMGWLFAVGLGLQERRLGAVLNALGPIALGHALAIGLVAVPVGLLQVAVPRSAVLTLGGLALLSFAAFKVATRFRHPRWVRMRVGSRQLIFWSFLMATVHGAGLMLVPVLAHLREADTATALAAEHAGHAGHLHMQTTETGDQVMPGLASALAAVSWHTAAMLLVMGALAVVVYRQLGVDVLRRAWINLDLIWVGALAISGGVTLCLGLWRLLAG